MELSVTRAFDSVDIYPVVKECFSDIVEDNTDYGVVEGYVDTIRDCWLKVGSCGFVQLTPYNSTMLEIHPFIRPTMRAESEKAVTEAIHWFDENAPKSYTSLITNVPSCKRYAGLFARKMGFTPVGVFKQGFYKQGKHYDMVLFQRMRAR